MARIPNDQLERIKTEVSLLNLVESQGYQPKKQGKDYAVCCPFHDDKTPSCIISPKSNLFNCFGCGVGGSVIDWVMKTQGLSFRHAVEVLQSDSGLTSSLVATVANTKPVKQTGKRKLDTLPLDQDDQALLNQVMDYYHETLLQSPDALAYLDKRGLHDVELIKHFKLGFANRTLAYRLPEKQIKAGKLIRTQLQKVGILRESGHEHFNGSLVVPVLDGIGNVQEVYGRKATEKVKAGTPKHLYLSGEHNGVWNAQGLQGCNEVIICEALLDAMTFWCHGFKNVTASYGT
jgi:DNA primase catalytic core